MTGIIRALSLLALVTLLSSCVATTGMQNSGTIRESHDVTQKYRSLTIDPIGLKMRV